MKKTLTILLSLLLFSSAVIAEVPQPFSIILDWFVNPTHAPIIIAQKKGFFHQQGLKVKIIIPADPNDTAKLVALGKADIGIGSDPQLLRLVNAGLPLMRAGALIDKPLDALVTDKSISRLSDLKGKTLGYPVGGIDKIILSVMLHHVNLSLNDLNLVDVHFNLVQAILSKKVDAIIGAMRDYEVPQIKLHKLAVNIFYPEHYGMPAYAELNYIVNRKHKNNPQIKKFLNAVKQATFYIKKHPKKSWKILSKAYPELNNQLNKISWELTYPLFTHNPANTNKANFMKLVKLMHQYHWLKKIHAYHYYVV